MTKVLKFRVAIDLLEDKIWREIEITDRRSVADLAYTILASFNSLAYHLYSITYKDKIYDSWVCIEEDYSGRELINAVTTKLSSISLKENDVMKMEYDTGSTVAFTITYLGEKEFEVGNGMHYPCVINGMGYGMIDDITNDELKDIVDDSDKTGKSDYYTLSIEGNNSILYDYRKFDIAKNNLHIKRYFSKIKNGYEDGE